MGRVVSEKQINSFIKGLITEASPLTYPENSSLDEDNFVLNRNGSRSLRLGMDYEASYALTDTSLNSTQLSSTRVEFYRWDYAGGDENTSLGVVRVYNKLWFLDLFASNPSANLKNSGSSITITGLSSSSCDYAIINHKLILVSKDLDKPVILSYNSTTDTVSQSTIDIEIRDFFGVDDGLTLTDRPTTLSTEHKYNLRNQGWVSTIVSTCGTDAIDCTYSTVIKYPSNADIWTYGQIADVSSANYNKYDPNTMLRDSNDATPAPLGKYILDIYARGASRESNSGLSGLPSDTESGRISTIASFAGRVFYSGILSNISGGDSKSPNYTGYVFFTQTVTADDKLGKCYQEADPTSDKISDIIDTDGGTIHIPEASKIVRLISTRSSLLIFAENGVWEVYAGDAGFRATEYQLTKITSVGVVNRFSIVDTGNAVAYWAKGGIYVVAPDQVTGRFSAQNISLTSVQTLYNDISEISKRYVKSVYDERENTIRWLYNDDASYDGSSFSFHYKKELILDLSLGSFYKHSISELASNSPFVCDYITTPNFISTSVSDLVLVNGVQVQQNTVDVQMTTDVPATRRVSISYLTIVPGTTYSFTVSKYQNDTFYDWKTKDGTGVAINAYLVTGYELFGDIMRKKQVPYILFYFNRTEDAYTLVSGDYVLDNQSSCLVQAQWNWADSANSGKWGTEFQAYRLHRLYIPSSTTFDYGEGVIVTKSKLRGSGRCLSLKIRNEAGKDMQLLGWAIKMSGNSDV